MAFSFVASTPAATTTPAPLFSSTPSLFASSTPAQAPSPTPSLFGAPQQPQQQQQQPQASGLLTNDRTPVSYTTKWSDIHPDSQKLLQGIEEKILEYRDESWRLDQCERLNDTSALDKGFELDATRLTQELSGVGIAIVREQVSSQDLMKTAKEMLRHAEVAVRSFMMLSLRFPRPSAEGLAPMHVSDFYSGFPVKPSPFLQQTVARFEAKVMEYRQWIEELEKLLLRNDMEDKQANETSLLQSLPTVMSNVHDFFVYVAAQVESLHEFLESMRLAFLADQRRRGEDNNPFEEADRRETARREAAAKRVHPSALKPSENPGQAAVGAAGVATAVPIQTPTAPAFATSSPAFAPTQTTPFFTPAPTLSTTPTLFNPSTAGPPKPKISRNSRRK